MKRAMVAALAKQVAAALDENPMDVDRMTAIANEWRASESVMAGVVAGVFAERARVAEAEMRMAKGGH